MNPTLFTLLRMGCFVIFPSGYVLTGDPTNGYIDLSTPFGKDGCRSLSRCGVLESLKDEKKYRKENK